MKRNPIQVDEVDRIAPAKSLLCQIVDRPRTIAEIYAYCKTNQALTKREIKAARKELGLRSYEAEGVRFWAPAGPKD